MDLDRYQTEALRIDRVPRRDGEARRLLKERVCEDDQTDILYQCQ